jgi:polyhydroxybutyrate depolymerase
VLGRWALAATLAATLVATACGGDEGPSHPPSTTAGSAQERAAAATCPPAGLRTVEGGLLRIPPAARPGATPLLVVVVPGGRGDRSDRLGLGRAADDAGFALLYPTSAGDGFWTLNDEQGTADVTAVAALLDRQAAGGCFDPRRVSITGVSNGAGFATRMACERPGRFAALVAVAAGFRALDPCPDAARTSFLAIHGTADTVVPFNGKRPDRAGSVRRQTARWARRAGCDRVPRASTPRRLVTRLRHRGCDDGLRVELLRLSGTDHGWPGAGPPLPDRNPSGLSATREVLRFVARARRPV